MTTSEYELPGTGEWNFTSDPPGIGMKFVEILFVAFVVSVSAFLKLFRRSARIDRS